MMCGRTLSRRTCSARPTRSSSPGCWPPAPARPPPGWRTGCSRPAVGGGIYKRLAEFGPHDATGTFRRLSGRSYEELAAVSTALAARLGRAGVGPADLLLDAPPPHREVQFEIDVLDAAGVARPRAEVSPVTRTLAAEQFDEHVKRVRLFCRPGLRGELRDVNWAGELAAVQGI